MDLNKLRVMQMIQLALFKKGLSSHVDTVCVDGETTEVMVCVFGPESNVVDNFALSTKTESELLEWHVEIERV